MNQIEALLLASSYLNEIAKCGNDEAAELSGILEKMWRVRSRARAKARAAQAAEGKA
jgi:hypothetical protein